MPSGWINAGGFTVNNGLNMSGAGGTNQTAYWNSPSDMENVQMSMEVVLNNVNSEIALTKLDQTSGSLHGIIASLDGVNNRIVFYNRWNDSSPLSVAMTQTIPFSLVSGHTYTLTLNKYTTGSYMLSVYDQSTASTTSLTLSGQDNLVGSADGYPGVMFLGGNVTVNNFSFSESNSEKPKLIIFGDSITEWGGNPTRYSSLISNALNGDVVIAAAGQDTTNTIIQRLPVDLNTFNPEYVLVLAGTNVYVDTSTTISQLQTIVAGIIANGAVPILGTVPPRTVTDTNHITINNWIRSSGYKYIDFNVALAIGHDPNALGDPNLFNVDTVHPNTAGFLAMYNQALADAPYLFERNQQRVIGSGTTNTIPFWSNSFTLATTSMTMNNLGFIGIGTSTPSSQLDVAGWGTTDLTIDSNALNGFTGAGVVLRNFPNAGNWRGSGIFMFDSVAQNEWFAGRPYNSADNFIIGREGSISNHDDSLAQLKNSFLTVGSTGKVGIGTSSPSSLLNMYGLEETTLTVESRVSTGYMGADILLRNDAAQVNYRGAGVFMYDSGAQNEWFAGRPYNSADSYVIGRESSVTVHDPKVGISANFLFVINSTGSVGIGTTSPFAQLSVVNNATTPINGTLFAIASTTAGNSTTTLFTISANGNVFANVLTGGATTLSVDANGNIIRTVSDERLKKDITPITGALETLTNLQGVYYDFKDPQTYGGGRQIGLIAQQVAPYVPEVVSTGGPYESLNYGNLVALVIEAVKELDAKVSSTTAAVSNLVLNSLTSTTMYVNTASIDNLNVKNENISGNVCVDTVCITKDQFKQMLLNNGGMVTTATPQSQGSTLPENDISTSTDSVATSTSSTTPSTWQVDNTATDTATTTSDQQ